MKRCRDKNREKMIQDTWIVAHQMLFARVSCGCRYWCKENAGQKLRALWDS